MSRFSHPRSFSGDIGQSGVGAVLLVAITLCLFAALELAQSLGANWDEYNYLSKVHLLLDGQLATPLQTFHAHLFGWVSFAGPLEIDQILAARVAVWLAFVGTCLLLYLTGRRFLSTAGALFSVLCLASFSYVIEHANSFRADSLAAFCVLLSAWLFSRRGKAGAAASGLLLATAFLLTIKSVLLLPAWIGLAAWRLLEEKDRKPGTRARHATWFLLSASAGGAVLFLVHWLTLSEPSTGEVSSILDGSLSKTVLQTTWWPRWDYLYRAVGENPVFWVFWLTGTVLAAGQCLSGHSRRRLQGACLLLVALPMASLAFYRNAFPYFYAFLLPLPALLCGFGVDAILRRDGADGPARFAKRRPLWLALALLTVSWALLWSGRTFWFAPLAILPLLLWHACRRRLPARIHRSLGFIMIIAATGLSLLSAHDTWSSLDRGSQAVQRSILHTVHRTFPEGAIYIDRCSMVASFPRTGFFMSTWGMENYLERGEPLLARLIAQERPHFLLVNHPALDPSGTGISPLQLLQPDARALREHFVPYWGPIWIAGQRFALEAGSPVTISVPVAGAYRVEAQDELRIGDRKVLPGDRVQLDAAQHRASSPVIDQQVTLRLDVPPPPGRQPPAAPIFRGFGEP